MRIPRRNGLLGRLTVSAAALVSSSACGDDGSSGTGGADSGPTGTTSITTGVSGPSTTVPPTTGAEASSSGTNGVDTSGGGTTVVADTGTAGEASTGGSSTGIDGSSGSDEGATTAGGQQGYAECLGQVEMDVCLAGEVCIDDGGKPPGVGVCSWQDCAGAGGCPAPPPGGDAEPRCIDVTGDMVDDCVLDCSTGQTCPPGMACFASFVCVWGGGVGPGDFTCADDDLGAAMGPAVATGTTAGAGDDFMPGCVGPQSQDVQLVWTALVAGTYTFDTVGSDYDTILYVLDDCVGAELACNDDTMMLLSQVSVDLSAGESVLVVIDGYGGATGNYVLNIN